MKKIFFGLFFISLISIYPAIVFAQINLSFTTSNYHGVNVSCFGGRDGSVTVNVIGGTPPYSYLWSNGMSTASISDLPEGYYNVTVTDSDSTVVSDGLNLIGPKKIQVTLDVYRYSNEYNVSCFQCYNGSITTSVLGGVPGYTYHWSDGSTLQNRTGLGADRYVVTVIDLNDCPEPASAFLKEPSGSWTVNGNSGTNENQFIGTTDDRDLIFKTGGEERMRIGSDGIITQNSISKLETILTNRITSNSEDSVIHIGDSSIVISGATGFNQIYTDVTGTFHGLSICGKMDPITGIKGGNSFSSGDNGLSVGNYVKTTGANSIVIGSGKGWNGFGVVYLTNPNPNSLFIGFNSTVPTVVVTPASGGNSTGEVGIATTTIPTGFKLAVNGKIICTELKVRLYADWDKVFEGDYPLMPVSELKQFVNDNHHLPNIPSVGSMKSNEGLEIGNFQMQLLRQIEEQALYIIQQAEKLDDQEKRIMALELKLNK